MKHDHSSALESLAAEHNLNPLTVLEWFNERAAIREHDGGMSREYAEREALRDIREQLSGHSRTSQTQSVSKCVKEAGAT